MRYVDRDQGDEAGMITTSSRLTGLPEVTASIQHRQWCIVTGMSQLIGRLTTARAAFPDAQVGHRYRMYNVDTSTS